MYLAAVRRVRSGGLSARPAPSSGGRGCSPVGMGVGGLPFHIFAIPLFFTPTCLMNLLSLNSESFFTCASHLDSLCCLSFCASPVDPQGSGFSCLLSHISGGLLASINLCAFSSPFTFVLFSPYYRLIPYFISFPSFCEAFRKENRKACGQSSIFSPAAYNNVRSTTTGLSYFMLAFKIRKLTSSFLKGMWKFF